MSPFFSIIIPTYNSADKLSKAIKSVLDQTFIDFEIIVVDDGSLDNTKEIIFGFDDFRVKYFWIPNSGGPARPRNLGVVNALGMWICFLDADDWWKLNKLETCFPFLDNKVDILYHDLSIVYKSSNIFQKKVAKGRYLNSFILRDLLIHGNCINNSSVIIRKSIFDKIGLICESKEMVAAEDLNTWLRVAEVSSNFFYLPISLGFYYIDNTGLSSKRMTSSIVASTVDFIKYLNAYEKKQYEANLRYIDLSFNLNFIVEKYDFKEILFCLRYGSASIRVKSFFKFFLFLIKILKTKFFKKNTCNQ
jgi:glycosyltransferase involved in cell wall biosynthesis